jgi:V8-like Glu-specific endopeptidase
MINRALLIFLSLLPLASGIANAGVDPSLSATRSAVLTPKGKAVIRNLPLYPLKEGIGRVFTQPVSENGARALRVHFRIDGQSPSEPTWGVQILDKNGTAVWSFWAQELLGTDFWSAEIAGDAAKVEVYSVEPNNSIRLLIDRLAVRHEVTEDRSITGKNDMRPIYTQEPWIQEAGAAVARINFMGDDGLWYYCTGFLLTPDLLLTNQHCLATPEEALSAAVEFDYDSGQAAIKPARVRQLEAVNYDLDYSLVRLVKATDHNFLAVEENPHQAESLVIIQHPGGEPKQVSIKDCQTDGVAVEGRHLPNTTVKLTDFVHSCDTMKGSSGSPVLDHELKKVVGLHHLGFDNGKPYNRAVRISLILADIRAQRPGLLSNPPAATP